MHSISGQFFFFCSLLFVCSSISNTYIPRRRFDVCLFKTRREGKERKICSFKIITSYIHTYIYIYIYMCVCVCVCVCVCICIYKLKRRPKCSSLYSKLLGRRTKKERKEKIIGQSTSLFVITIRDTLNTFLIVIP